MIIDSHSHVMLPVEKQIELMNEAGIDKTVLFYTSIHPERATDFQLFEQEMGKLFKILEGHVNDAEWVEKQVIGNGFKGLGGRRA